jgi:hypothetical protein
MRRNWIVRGALVALVVALALVVFSWVVMSLWNWLIPGIIGWKAIDFWQALGLLVLSRILFGGFRGRFGYGMHWRARMAERWQRMTPEEREKFRAGMHGRCGHRTEDPVASGEH